MLIELRQALISYQDYHMLLLTPQAGDEECEWVAQGVLGLLGLPADGWQGRDDYAA